MISVFDLFKIGIGPSSSHTVGPMKAAASFVALLNAKDRARLARIKATLYGSLAWTGRGHGTDRALMLGLSGLSPETVDSDQAAQCVERIMRTKRLSPPGGAVIDFDPAQDICFDLDETPPHPNTVAFEAFDHGGGLLCRSVWHSIGGGFIQREGEAVSIQPEAAKLPYDFRSGTELIEMCDRSGLSIADIVLANETVSASAEAVRARADRLIAVMFDCIDRGIRAEGELPGGLKVKRRAASLYAKLREAEMRNAPRHSIGTMEHASVYAIAVNEENAAGGRVVTAPTNGAAGVMPAVMRYYAEHCPDSTQEGLRTLFFTGGAIGILYKMNASISGAEVGCQGEVGVACSMAAAGLTAALGGSPRQAENAAEIGMEHHLGLTCDPVGGLVQIPCIERNAFGAIKAINASSLALNGDGSHHVTLDQVIRTMRETGADMQAKYKETSRGGLAANVPVC
jgi:L-serine dehydratase